MLTDARRLWRWFSYATLSELSVFGPHPNHISECKFGVPIEITLNGDDICEVIECHASAEMAIKAVPQWRNS